MRVLFALLASALVAFGAATAQASAASGATTGAALNVQQRDALLTGSIEPSGLETTWRFVFGPAGKPLLATPWRTIPAEASAATAVSERVLGLQPNTRYVMRLEARNENGLALGALEAFTTLAEVARRAVRFKDVVTFPKRCVRRRRAVIRFRAAGPDRQLKRVTVFVNGRRRARLDGFRRTAKVTLKKMSRRARVSVVVVLADGSRVTGRRTLRACRKRR